MAAPRPADATSFVWTPLRSRWRWPLSAATIVAAAAHIPVIAPHLHQAPYMGEEFIVLTAACLLLAGAALACDSAAVYSLVALTCGLAVIGYVATRLVAFPLLGDDVGTWLEPLGVLSIAAETVGVLAALCGLLSASRESRLSGRPWAGPVSKVIGSGVVLVDGVPHGPSVSA